MQIPHMRTLCALLALVIWAGALPARAVETAALSGFVVDAATGVPLTGVAVSVDGTTHSATTDTRGRFVIDGLPPSAYRIRLSRSGYQPALSERVQLRVGVRSVVALSLIRATGDLHTIAVTSTSASHTLTQSSAYTIPVNTEQLQRAGIVRAADALRTLPAVNNGITGDTAALGDDVNLNIRGIGTLETVATLDGHPIGYGIKGGYNYQLSPVYPYRDVSVLYGSGGSGILGVNAIGGVINFQTLDATTAQHATLTQGYGTFARLASSLALTGTQGRLGYALAYGTSGLDGPFRNATFYQPAAQASYTDDSSVVSKAALIKLRYQADDVTTLTFTDVNQSYWENKTGNGDGDYLPYQTALARGIAQNLQNPAQYAAANAGWQGTGPAWQAFNFGYQDLDARRTLGGGTVDLDAFTTFYFDTAFRENLPYKKTPGDTDKQTDAAVKSSGSIASDEFAAKSNDMTLGYSYLNNVYDYTTIKPTSTTNSYPVDDEKAFFIRDVYHAASSPLSLFFNAWARHASATDSSYLDPRLSVVDRVSTHDVVRVAYGATTTEPSSDEIGLPFTPSALAEGTLQGAGGGQTYVCGGLNSIGSAPSSILKPERGVDQEAAYAHSWASDSLISLQLYNVNVYDKLYSTIVPLSQSGSSFIDPAYVVNAQNALNGVCGANNYQLGVTGTVNVGTMRARGADISGRLRMTRHLYADYDWALTSSALVNAPAPLLETNLTDILGSQIARVPLHTFDGSLDNTFGSGIDARWTLHWVSSGNTKSLPAYDYSDLRVSVPTRSGTLSVTVSNLFNQYANIAGLIGEGVPLPLNSYAKASNYAPLIGTAATEQYGLPYRQIYISYQWRR